MIQVIEALKKIRAEQERWNELAFANLCQPDVPGQFDSREKIEKRIAERTMYIWELDEAMDLLGENCE